VPLTTPNKADGTKCLNALIGHHYVNVQSRKSIWTLIVGGCTIAFPMRHGELLHMKKIMNEKKESFLMDKTQNKNKIEKYNHGPKRILNIYSKSDFANSRKQE
jgi:hypothetical protein